MTKLQFELYNVKYALYMVNVRIAECIDKSEINALLLTRTALEKELDILYKEVQNEIQNNCSHQLWYVIDNTSINNNNVYKCKCMNCGLIRKSLAEDFYGKTISYEEIKSKHFFKKEMYDLLNEEYVDLKSVFNADEASNILLSKYKRN